MYVNLFLYRLLRNKCGLVLYLYLLRMINLLNRWPDRLCLRAYWLLLTDWHWLWWLADLGWCGSWVSVGRRLLLNRCFGTNHGRVLLVNRLRTAIHWHVSFSCSIERCWSFVEATLGCLLLIVSGVA